MLEIYLTTGLLILTSGFLYWFWFSPIGVLAMKEQAGGEVQVDVRLYYSPATLYRLFETYGEKGRKDFRTMLLVDMVFPLVYSAALCCLADVLGDHGLVAERIENVSIIAALCAAFFDYCENTMLLRVLKLFPERHTKLAYSATCASSLKMLCSNLMVIVLVLGLLAQYID